MANPGFKVDEVQGDSVEAVVAVHERQVEAATRLIGDVTHGTDRGAPSRLQS
jgi:hypothetical protein